MDFDEVDQFIIGSILVAIILAAAYTANVCLLNRDERACENVKKAIEILSD